MSRSYHDTRRSVREAEESLREFQEDHRRWERFTGWLRSRPGTRPSALAYAEDLLSAGTEFCGVLTRKLERKRANLSAKRRAKREARARRRG